MRPNRKPLIKTSQLPSNLVSLREDWPAMVACPICRHWRIVKRSMLTTHRAADGKTRCPGSGWPIKVDETAEEWQHRKERDELLAAANQPVQSTTRRRRVTLGPRSRKWPVRSSELPKVATHKTWPTQATCPICGKWISPDDWGIPPHYARDNRSPCTGGGMGISVEGDEVLAWRTQRDLAPVACG